jgi:asparagine synthase (glutamine-hydrolysing)
MLARYVSLLRLGLIHPRLAVLAWNLKRAGKTYLGYPQLLSLTQGFLSVKARRQRPPHVAEFGVGRGGSATLLAWLVGRYGGTLTLYDVFGRIPAPTDRDGERAQVRYQEILHREGEDYYGNVPDLAKVIVDDLSSVCSLEQIEVVPGRYEETLGELDEARSLDLVHIDCDWYESSKAVFKYLQGNVSPGAIMQVDDYSNWQGSHMAVDEADWLEPFKTRLVDGALVIDTGVAGL